MITLGERDDLEATHHPILAEAWWSRVFVRRLPPRDRLAHRAAVRSQRRLQRWLEGHRIDKTLPAMLRAAELRGRVTWASVASVKGGMR